MSNGRGSCATSSPGLAFFVAVGVILYSEAAIPRALGVKIPAARLLFDSLPHDTTICPCVWTYTLRMHREGLLVVCVLCLIELKYRYWLLYTNTLRCSEKTS